MSLKENILKLELDALKAKEDAKKIKVRLESVASLQSCIRPVLDPDILQQVQAGMVSIKEADTWAEWGFKSQKSVLLFEGEEGTGKTTTARWMAKHLERPLIPVSMGDIGGMEPGATERGIMQIYETGTKNRAIVFFDECDGLLWDRSNAGPDSMWMLGVINALLSAIEQYDFITILSTNFAKLLDKALARRVTFRIHFAQPSLETRKKLWMNKWPKWPLSISNKIIAELAQLALNGSSIETAIEQCARFAILKHEKPTYKALLEISSRIARENSQQREDSAGATSKS